MTLMTLILTTAHPPRGTFQTSNLLEQKLSADVADKTQILNAKELICANPPKEPG
jgi:hypothetical protein